jgi:hypothetical protein
MFIDYKSRQAVPSKSELKKRAKQLEKEQKAAQKAARQQEIADQQAAADVVSLCPSLTMRVINLDVSSGFCSWILWEPTSQSVARALWERKGTDLFPVCP